MNTQSSTSTDRSSVLCETPVNGITMPDRVVYHGDIWVFGPIRTAYVMYQNVKWHLVASHGQWLLTGKTL